MFIDRNELIEEERLRIQIREAISVVKKKRLIEQKNRKLEEAILREFISKLIEAETTDAAPHSSTGINVLEDLLKKIIPQLEDEYKKLTTDPQQRESFRAHVINATQNALAPTKAIDDVDPEEAEKEIDISLEEEEAGAIEMDVGGDPADIEGSPDEEQFIDIDGAQEPEEPSEEEKFGVEGEDETGRNMAFMAFQKVEKSIVDAYNILNNDEDRELFYDYLLTNLKLYFDKFEDELASILPEPTNQEYEDEKDSQEDDAEEGGLGDDEGGDDLGDLGGDEELGGDDELEL